MSANAISNSAVPRKENVCAVVVSYFPDSDFPARLQRITPQVGLLLVIDNHTTGTAADCLRDIELKLGTHVVRNSCNLGIATALNQGARWAEEHRFTWMLTLDQDSLVPSDMIETLQEAYEQFTEKDKLAVIGSNYDDPVAKTQFAAATRNGGCLWKVAKTVITSGSLVSLPAYRVIGEFREELFIDGVDFDYCLRAWQAGFRVILALQAVMQHPIGAASVHKLPWKTTGTRNYSPIRRYYMTRNQLILGREFLWKEPQWTLSTLYRHLKSTILMCLFEKDVRSKMRYTAMGVLDGLCSNFNRKLT
jgi:rhamnosyltransferase